MASTHAQGAPPRVYYRTKAEWAEARAKDLRDQARTLQFQPTFGIPGKAARKYEQVANLRREASKFERMAATFRKKHL